VVTHGGKVPEAYVRVMPGPHGDVWNAVMRRAGAVADKGRRAGRTSRSGRSGHGRPDAPPQGPGDVGGSAAGTARRQSVHGGTAAAGGGSVSGAVRGGSPTTVVAPTGGGGGGAAETCGDDGPTPAQLEAQAALGQPLELRTVRFCQKCQVWWW
jgi:hypothetical protein